MVSKQTSSLQRAVSSLSDPSSEQYGFSARLHQSLRNADYSPDSPTQLAREFNIRFSGHRITVHAARKWLVGEAIPTQEKLRTLAQWLGVSAEWLRFGGDAAPGDERNASNNGLRLSADVTSALEILQQLDDHHRHIAHRMLRVLLQSNSQKISDKVSVNS